MNPIEQLQSLIRHSKHTVFFGGAGVSTASGIPDFRSESGLYKAEKVYGQSLETLLSHSMFRRDPALFFRYYKENLIHIDAKPNAAHLALARLEEMGLLHAVVTQNIDGLHQAAGSRTVYELHGSNHRHYCVQCRHRYTLGYVLAREGVPLCEHCGAIVRPEVVLYEESLDDAVVSAALEAISRADLLIVGGTSLAVYPAAGMLRYFAGGHLVLINRTETGADRHAQLIFRDAIADVLAALVKDL